jgi:hypothetical protein
MRETEKHLVDVPLKQLSRLSHLIQNLRNDPESIEQYKSYTNLMQLVLDTRSDAILDGGDAVKWNAVCRAIRDLISEAVWPK